MTARCATASFRSFAAAAVVGPPSLRRRFSTSSGAAAAAARLPSFFSCLVPSAAAASATVPGAAAAAPPVSLSSACAAARATRETAGGTACIAVNQGRTRSLLAASAAAQAASLSFTSAAVPFAPSAAGRWSSAFACCSALLLRRGFAAAAAAREGGSLSNRLLLTLSSPSEAIYIKTPVHSVTVPGSEGAMTLTNGHSQMVARLKAGEIIVRRDASAGGSSDATADRYFVSDGFLLFSSPEDDSGCCTAEVLGIELVPVHVLDKEKAVAVLQTLLQQGAAAADDWTKTRTLLGRVEGSVEGHSSPAMPGGCVDTLKRCNEAPRDHFFFRQELLSSVIRVAS